MILEVKTMNGWYAIIHDLLMLYVCVLQVSTCVKATVLDVSLNLFIDHAESE